MEEDLNSSTPMSIDEDSSRIAIEEICKEIVEEAVFMWQSPATFWESRWQSSVLHAVQEVRDGEWFMQALSLWYVERSHVSAKWVAKLCAANIVRPLKW